MLPKIRRFLAKVILVAFLVNMPVPLPMAHADDFVLPQPGVRIALSPAYQPSLLVGMQVNPKNPFQLNFIFDPGQKVLSDQFKRKQYRQIVEYFLASLTIPNQDMWVNLSPYEKNRIIPDNFGQTYMGRDLLSEDYLLKQMTSSLIYPQDDIGKEFWQEIYKQAQKSFGTANIPVNTFNKVWIVPDKAEVYEKDGTVFIVSSHLKVMLEEDYLSFIHHAARNSDTQQAGTLAARRLVLPVLEKEINEGKNFAMLRQIYSAMLMATWFKKTLRQSILGQAYADRSKLKGIDLKDPQAKQRIYQEYLKAFKKGVFNFIQEDQDPLTHETIPRKYFSGGIQPYNEAMITPAGPQEIADFAQNVPAARWDTAEVLLQQFFNAPVFPAKEDRERFAGQGQVLSSLDEFDEQKPELGWVPLTDHIIVRFVNRREPFGFYLRYHEIKREGKDPIYTYELPEDITVQEILQLIEEMQKLPLANQEKIILPQTARRFLQLAQVLTKYQSEGNYKTGDREFITALKRIANKLGEPDGTVIRDRDTEHGIKEWFGIEDISDVQTMMARVIELGVQSVQIELEELTFWRGEKLFKHGLALAGANEYPSEIPDTDSEKVKVIQEILAKVRVLPGWDAEDALQVLEQEAPNLEVLINGVNCVGKSALTALYLNESGIKVFAVDVNAYQDKSNAAEHVLLLAHLSGDRYFWVEPSKEDGKSHEIRLSLNVDQIPAQGLVWDLSKEQYPDPDLKRVYIGPWRPMITAIFYSSIGAASLIERNGFKGDINGAIAYQRKALMLYPGYSTAYTNLGTALSDNGEGEKALAMHEKATRLNPDNAKAWNNWGAALFSYEKTGAIYSNSTKQFERAVEFRQEQVRLKPYSSEAHNNLGTFLEKSGERKEAIQEHRIAVELDPRNSIAWHNLGFALWKDGAWQEAVQDYWEAFGLNPTNKVIRANLEDALSNMKDFQGLADLYRKVIELEPDNTIAPHKLADALYSLKHAPQNNQAMTAPGGIDLNEDLLDMRIKRDGKGVPLAMRLQGNAVLNIQGLAPVIVRILPFKFNGPHAGHSQLLAGIFSGK